MPSPFPGMDPWLEDVEYFRDLHNSLITYLREALNAGLPAGYRAVSNTLVWIDEENRREPDESIFGRDRFPSTENGSLAVMPGLLAIGEDRAVEPWEEPYLEIVSGKGKRVVTAIEIVSLSNKKPGDKGRDAYQNKQKEFRRGGVNLVEIDLLRRGPHTTAVPLARLQRKAGPFDYHVSVTVAGSPTRFYAAAFQLTDRLPTIPIPLDLEMPPITIDLQPLLDRCYDTGRYGEDVEYDQPCDPPLTPEQQSWADGILREKCLLK